MSWWMWMLLGGILGGVLGAVFMRIYDAFALLRAFDKWFGW